MNIKELARAPKLIKLTIDDEETVAQYGESLDFYMYDRQPTDVFLKLVSVDENVEKMFEVIQTLILDEKGKQILEGGKVLPMNLVMSIVNKVVEYMGKPEAPTTQK